MDKQPRKNFPTFPRSEEVIDANNYEQSSWKITEEVGSDHSRCGSTLIDSAKEEDSNSSNSFLSSSSSSSRSSDLMEDASSSSSSSASSSNGPLYQLSELMDQLPIKRGLSKYYQGKSQSFTSLANVQRLEDLAKRENPYKKRLKLCKSYCGGFDGRRFCSPKATISKKSSSTLGRKRSNHLLPSCRPPLIPVDQKQFLGGL